MNKIRTGTIFAFGSENSAGFLVADNKQKAWKTESKYGIMSNCISIPNEQF